MKKLIFLPFILQVFFAVAAHDVDSRDFHVHRAGLQTSFSKFDIEKQGRVAFLGGSITYNGGWRDSLIQYFEQRFAECDFDFINAGIPSMGSTPGAFRFERDVLKNGSVDLLFVEAAVNDRVNGREEKEIQRAVEGIVRHAKIANPACDIVLMYFVDPEKMEDYRAGKIPAEIALHERIAKHYGISSINLAKEVTARIDAGEFSWESDFKDLHPSPFGQDVYARSMIRFLDDAKNGNAAELPNPLDKAAYSKGILVEPAPPRPIKGWTAVENWKPDLAVGTRANYVNVPMLAGDYPGEIIKFQFKGTAVGIAVAAGPDAGIIEYSIDGEDWVQLDLFTQWSKHLYLPWYYTLEAGLKDHRHTLQIRLTDEKNPESTGNKCLLRYFYYNAGE